MAAIGGPLYLMFLAPPPDHAGSDAEIDESSTDLLLRFYITREYQLNHNIVNL